MGKTLQELGLREETLPTAGEDLDDLPTFGGFAPPPPAGAYRVKLPMDLNAVWDLFDTPDLEPKQRVRLQLDREHPLLIVQSPGGKSNQEPYETSLTNKERKRGKDGVVASDLDYLLRALGEKAKPKSNPEYIRAVQRHAGQEFGADIRYRWHCSRDRDIRARDAAGQIQVIEGKPGCGTSYYQEDVQKNPDGSVPYEVTCSQCGAWLRAFSNLDNLRP
jgi:hypothetical protein